MGHYPNSYNFIPMDAIDLDWDATKAMFPDSDNLNDCMLVALPWRAISVLVSVLRFAEYWHLWGLPTDETAWTEAQRTRWYEIQAFISEVEVCLMTGCSVSDLITTNRMLIAALVGQEITDLAEPLPSAVDYTVTGIGPRLDALTAAVSGSGSGNLEEELTDLGTILQTIAVVAGA